MSMDSVNEVPFTLRRRQRGTISKFWARMGFLFEILRDLHPALKVLFDTMTLIGIVWSVKTGLSFSHLFFQGFKTHVWARISSIDLKKRYGEWVVITGATDGIGLEYGKEFARRGHSLILIGRSESKLQKAKQDICRIIHPDRVITITLDLNSQDPDRFEKLTSEIAGSGRDIGILVNNAGVMHESPNRFLDQPLDGVMQHVRVNIGSVLLVTRSVLPLMVLKKKGLVINMSSIAGYQPLPLMGVYSASKKFVEYFSKTLQYEYSGQGIQVQTLIPSYVSTKMTQWSNMLQSPNVMTPTAETFSKAAIATIGRSDETTGYWGHGLQWFMYEWMTPTWLYSLSSWYLLQNIDSTKKGK